MGIIQNIEEKFNPKSAGNVRLWWVSPSFVDLKKICTMLDNELFYASNNEAYSIIWMRPSWFGARSFVWPQFNKWIPRSSLVSGSGKNIHIGVLFSKHFDEEDKCIWKENRTIWSICGGSKSSETCKWVLDKLMPKGGVVIDCYAVSPELALWCRRMNLEYRGYADNQGVRAKIKKELAQLEIPGIQEELPL